MNSTMKILILLILSFQANGYDLDSWVSTTYIYLAKPTYIYKTETKIEELGGNIAGKADGKSGMTLSELVIRVKQSAHEQNTVFYNFEIQEVIYGESQEYFSLEFNYEGEYQSCNFKDDFNNHNSDEFWNTEIGRSRYSTINSNMTSCFGKNRDSRKVDSCFEMDKLYLLIGNDELKIKQYEVINSMDDEWLLHVREKAKQLLN